DGEKVVLYPYYSDEACTQLVYAAGATDEVIKTALNKAFTDTNTALNTAISGKNLSTLTAEDLNNPALKEETFKTALGNITKTLTNSVPLTAINAYLAKDATLKPQFDMLFKVYEVSTTITTKSTGVTSEVSSVATPSLPAGAPNDAPAVTQQMVDDAVAVVETNVAHKSVDPGTTLSDAFGGNALNAGTSVVLSLQPKLTDITLEATVVTNAQGEPETVLVPQTLVFEITPHVSSNNTDPGRQILNSELNGNPITFTISMPDSVTTSHVQIVHQFTGGGSETFYLPIQSQDGKKFIEMSVKQFSYFTLTFTNTVPDNTPHNNSSDRGGMNRTASLQSQWDSFWDPIITKIINSNPGDIIKVNANKAQNVPAAVLKALYGKDVTLILTKDKVETNLNGLTMTAPEKGRVSYTFANVAKLASATPSTDVENNETISGNTIPATGGPIEEAPYIAGLQAPVVATPDKASEAVNTNPVKPHSSSAAETVEPFAEPAQNNKATLPILPITLMVGALIVGSATYFIYKKRSQN
ncbi:MAG: hypothetical protein RR263_00370, partial [Oscillospiraceae bacterium]